ncbi:phosphoenolpyruvate synthase [Patescibacteria group bacterium]|nr:phosphoenolpyruvate synthase [Patescibacteria group bacterium]
MSSAQPLILDFSKIDKRDIPLVGGKGANLGEMVKAGFPVPLGFAVTVAAYDTFLKENNLSIKIKKTLAEIDVNDPGQLDRASKNITGTLVKSKIPDAVAREVISAYKKLSGRLKHSLVAVRSSATAEDLPEASFAGQQETFLNIKGEASLLESIRACWASLFTARAIFYREHNKIDHEQVKISVIVQKMIQSEVSGVMFSIDPVTNEKDRIVIEAVWGLGELIVQGSVVPDRYVVQKETFSILSKEISEQNIQLVKKRHETKEVKVPKNKLNKRKLSDEDIVELARLADKLQKHYFFPQDVEWAKKGKELFIVQTRPVTTISKQTAKKARGNQKEVKLKDIELKFAAKPILEGTSASPGIGTGEVKIIKNAKQIDRVKKGDVLVSAMTSPDFVPAMKRAVAIVTDAGGATSHAAIVSRELGIPCVVGTKEATKRLSDGIVVTVDGTRGNVYLGSKVKIEEKKKAKKKIITRKTATKLYVNLAEPELAKEVSRKNVDGVGLLRAEFMIANIGIHPKEAIKLKKQDKFVDKLSKDLETFCKSFHPRPVVYRATDFKTNEYRSLRGGEAWEPEEPNPMLGFRGAYRYISSPEVFTLELNAIKRVREKYNNLWLMIPFVRSPEELAKVRRIVAGEGFFENPSFKFWMMVELPVNVILLEEFIKVGINGVSVGSNDLTMLLLGTDRDNAEVADAFDERSPSVYWALKKVIKICHKHNVTSSICGQAPSDYDDMVEKLIKMGITSISVNPDAINRVRSVIYEAEKEVVGVKRNT